MRENFDKGVRDVNSRLGEHDVGQSASRSLTRDESTSVLGEGVSLKVQETCSERTRSLWNPLVQRGGHVSVA